MYMIMQIFENVYLHDRECVRSLILLIFAAFALHLIMDSRLRRGDIGKVKVDDDETTTGGKRDDQDAGDGIDERSSSSSADSSASESASSTSDSLGVMLWRSRHEGFKLLRCGD